MAHENIVYYKNYAMESLDREYGDLPTRFIEEQIALIADLNAIVVESEDMLLGASKIFGELDSLLALTSAAEKYGWTPPQMTTANVINITEGRHPLQEMLVPSYIPNDCNIVGGPGSGNSDDGHGGEDTIMTDAGPSMLVLTGANNSGKSVYMKQVAIIVFLAHIGSYVPARQATIGITDRILTRINTRESSAVDESAFLIDVKQAAFAVNFATRRSLILTDEFGKGTSMEEGAAILAAFLAHFLKRGLNCPKVLVCTHFHDIFDRGIITERQQPEQQGAGVAFAHFDVHLDPDAQEPEDQIACLYKLLPGRSASSLGILCAALNGVEPDVVARAQELADLMEELGTLKGVYPGSRERYADKISQAEMVAKRFLEMEIPSGNGGLASIRARLKQVLGDWSSRSSTSGSVHSGTPAPSLQGPGGQTPFS